MNNLMKAALLACVATGLSTASASAQSIGVNAAIRNAVQMKTSRDAGLRKAVVKERVSLNDDIATGAGSALQILLLDRTSLTVGANARMKVDRFTYDPARSASAVGASVAKGAFRFMSGKSTRNAPGQSSIRTSVATIGIRGTILEGVVGADAVRIARGEAPVGAQAGNSDEAALIVLRGPGRATQGDERPGAIDVTANGSTIAVESPGLALFVPGPNAAPIGPFAISDSGLELLHQLLRTEPDKRRSGADVAFDGSPIVDMTFECEGSFGGQVFVDPVTGQVFTSSSSSSESSGCFAESHSDGP